MITVTTCPICGNNKFTPHLTCGDYSISKEIFNILRCSTCTFTFTSPRPDTEEMGKYYQSDIYISHHANKGGIIPWIYRIIRDMQFVNKTNIIKRYTRENISILDIGCGTGAFLEYCKKLNWNVIGVEPDQDARNSTKEKSITVYDLDNLNTSNENYDVITMWHVLEHVHDLDQRMKQLSKLIKEDGIVIIAVPNYKSYDSQLYKSYWAAYDLPRHLSHFSIDTITKLFDNHMFKLAEIIPMKYDSYYVSIKSEEYKGANKIMGFIKGVISGLKSNIKASRNNEYSSLIYVFKK